MPESRNLVNSQFSSASMPKKCTFRFQMHLFGTRRNPLYKRKHLGRVLEAQDRKSAFLIKKVIKPTPTAEISLKYVFAINFEMKVERVMGIEPTQSAWKAEALPLSYTRVS